jgi:hypothetical protein
MWIFNNLNRLNKQKGDVKIEVAKKLSVIKKF